MYNNKKIIAIIPARSGSKGLKDKNIKKLNGKPLIAYTIEAARKSGIFDKIIVSTDSEKYAEISRTCGAEVPFLRSAENSSDKAGSWDVVKEVLSRLEEQYDIIILLQPTSPLRNFKNIQDSINLFFKKNADIVFSVCETDHPAQWCGTLNTETLSAQNFIKNEYQVPRQKLEKTYTLNGAIYIIKVSCLEQADFYGKNSFVYIMDKKESVDIDNDLDFKFAELLIKESDKAVKEGL